MLIPIGTTEQHGHHLPLDTDCVIARSLCARTAELGEREGVELLVAPTLNVTLSWYHMQFPGSMRLSTTTFLQVFREICAVCWAEWLKYQQQLINHYALNLREPKARQYLLEQMEQFLFTSAPQT